MLKRMTLTAVLIALGTAVALGGEMMGVPGSSVRYDVEINSNVGGQPTPLTITGVALRKKLFFNVYAIASYVQKGSTIKSAEELAAADVPKMLHLTLERDLDGKDLGQAFVEAIRLNHAAPAFDAEVRALTEVLKPRSLKKGDHLQLVHVPGVGVECLVNGKAETVIKNVGFARAIWEIYLGPKNLGVEIKAMLTTRL